MNTDTTKSLLDDWREAGLRATDVWAFYQEIRQDEEDDESIDYWTLTPEQEEDEAVCEALFGTFSIVHSLTRTVVGDSAGWLDFFEAKCALGETPQPITLPDGSTMALETTTQLAELIDESKPGRKWDGLTPPKDEA